MNSAAAIIHASCVAFGDKGVLITGPSGSGKSSLALQLIALGGVLVADDRTALNPEGTDVVASAPPAIKGLIEARGVGLISLPDVQVCKLALVIDMARQEQARLPKRHHHRVLDIALPCLHKVDAPYFPAAILAYLRGTIVEAE